MNGDLRTNLAFFILGKASAEQHLLAKKNYLLVHKLDPRGFRNIRQQLYLLSTSNNITGEKEERTGKRQKRDTNTHTKKK